MKRLGSMILCAVALIAGSCFDASAQITPPTQGKGFSTGAASAGTTLSSAIVSANGAGTPRLFYLSATSDKAAAVAQFYVASSAVQTSLATNASQAVIWVNNSNSANDILVLRHVAADTYERLVVSSATTTNITCSTSLATAVVIGDYVYTMGKAGKIPVGAATKEVVDGGGFWYGKAGLPGLVDVDGTSACTLNMISGRYDP